MRVTSCSLRNFASYKSLEFNFNDQGLCLIQGPTGSGKSTLCDAIPWVLFGRTAKGGAVNEVLSWPGNNLTSGGITLSTGETIYRSRGPKSGDNDCVIIDIDGYTKRGKDLTDTQKLINNLLGFDAELYLSGAYFHEFSQASQFFTTTAKNRRAICEQVVDLSLAKKLQLVSSDRAKMASRELVKLSSELDILQSLVKRLDQLQKSEATKVEDWEHARKDRVTKLQQQTVSFENARWAKIERLEEDFRKESKQNICKECGSIKIKDVKHAKLHRLKLDQDVEEEKSKENPYIEYVRSIENEINPHLGSSKDYTKELADKNKEMLLLQSSIDKQSQICSDLDLLSDVINDFRGQIVKSSILQLENQTNAYLNNHFDSEIKVSFEILDADKLEVEITKDGNICSYVQLSKGQRQLLKLCFGVSVMKAVSNQHAINFDQIFFDESLDGMDDNIKLKAFNLFQTLETEHSSVFVVEHSSAIKTCFNNSVTIELINGASQIEAN